MHPAMSIDPARCGGVPVFTGTRVPVRLLFEYLEDGLSLAEFLDQFPSVAHDQAVSVLESAAGQILAVA